jgi:hypothetical protein
MTKIVYNQCYGGFSLSEEAIQRYSDIKGLDLQNSYVWRYPDDEWFEDREIPRNDPALVQVVEELGEAANGPCAKLAIYELPAGTLYRIEEYDGMEHIETVETIKWKVA